MPAAKPSPDAARRIVVYGASGYTGRLISAELRRRGVPIVIAGRSREKLERLASELDGDVEVAAARLDDGASLRGLLGPGRVVIGCAGPFTLHGEPLIAAAAETGAHYLDTTGEQPFIRASFERHGERAEASGAALVSGMGFDYAPGDMLASLTAAGLGEGRLEELTLAYSVRGFSATRGTTLSALEMVKGGDVEWRDGSLRPTPRYVGAGTFRFPSPIGERRVGLYPAGEQITVPRHVEVESVRTLIDLRTLLPVSLGPLSAPALSASGLAMATPLRGLAARLVDRLPEGPSESARRAARFTIACEARRGTERRTGVVRGGDVYGSTAVLLAEGATRMAAAGYERSGALAPAQAFEPDEFMAALAPFGIALELGGS